MALKESPLLAEKTEELTLLEIELRDENTNKIESEIEIRDSLFKTFAN